MLYSNVAKVLRSLSTVPVVSILVMLSLSIDSSTVAAGEYNLTPIFHSSIGKLAPLEYYDVAVTVGRDGNVYLVDLYRRTVQKRLTSGALLLEFSLQEKRPRNITIDQDGSLYTICSFICKVRKYSPGGELLLEWGLNSDQPGGFKYPQGIAIDKQQRVIVVDGTTQISAFDDDGNLLWNNMDTVSSNGKLTNPQAVAIGPNGYIYVADTGNDRIAKFGPEGNFVKTLNSTTLRAPVGIAVAMDGSVLVHDRKQRLDDIGEPQIYKFSPEGELLQSWGNKGREPGELWEAQGIAMGPDDTLWVAGYHGHNVLNFDLNGNLISEWNDHNIIGGEFALIRSTAVGKDGKVYMLDRWNQVVQVFDRYGGFQFMWGDRGQGDGPVFDFPTNVATDHNGNVYVCDTLNVRKFDEDGNILGRITGGLSFAYGSVVDRSGDIWVVNGHKNEIIKYKQHDHSYELDFIIGSNDLPGGLNQPHGICQGPNGMIYIADTFNHRIVRLDRYGNFDMSWGSYGKETGQFMAPCGLANDTQGHIYVSETWGERIQVFTSEGEYLHGWGSRGSGPGKSGDIFDLALDGDYFLYAPDQGVVHKYALVPDFTVSGKPDYSTGEELGYFIWSEDTRIWHVRWSASRIQHTFEGTVHSTSPIVGSTMVDRESAEDSFISSTHRVDFLAEETSGEDGMDIVVAGEGIITFDLRIDGLPTSDLVKLGEDSRIPTTLPLPLMTTLNPVGCPSYTPAEDPGYFLWQDADDREWHLRWSGDSIKTYHYTGTILTNSQFTDASSYSYEGNDQITVDESIISFDAYAGAGEDGIDFFVPPGSQVSFELYIDDIEQPDMVHVGQTGTSPGNIPFTITGLPACIADFDSDGDVDGSDLSVFAVTFGTTNADPNFDRRCDFDNDRDVDGRDLAIFSAEFGKTDCQYALDYRFSDN